MDVSDASLRQLLQTARTIAIVGLSDQQDRDSNEVARYLQGQGYRIIPVNPTVQEILGEKSYPSLSAIPPEIRIHIVDIFRRSEMVPPIVEEAVRRGAGAVWMQLGVESVAGGEIADRHHLPSFQNLCLMGQHRRLRIPPVPAHH
jgi:predicted CoA-binding protein